MKSLLPGQSPETLTRDDAVKLLSLPRTVGTDPDTNEPVIVDLGRYGPYARRGTDTRSLPSPEVLFTLTLEESRALFAQPKSFRRGQAAPIRELGPHPASQAPVRLMSGRYGPYVTDGTVNASLPRGASPEALTMEEAVALLAERAQRAPSVRPTRTARSGPRAATRSRAAAAGKSKPVKSGTGGKTGKSPVKASARKKAAVLPASTESSSSPRRPVVRKKRAAGE
jgi:DNA topoisomerase-1